MSWPVSLPADVVERLATVVVEGEIAMAYRNYIPGVSPKTRGDHYLFRPTLKMVRANDTGKALWHELQQIGFWTYPDFLKCNTNTIIRVALLLHLNREGYLTLMPYPCSNYSAFALLILTFSDSLF